MKRVICADADAVFQVDKRIIGHSYGKGNQPAETRFGENWLQSLVNGYKSQ